MCGVAVLNPHDVLRDGFNFNRMPLLSPSPSTSSTKDSFNSRYRNPNPKTVLNSNPRTQNLSRFQPTKNSNFGNNVLPRSSTSAKISHGPNLVMGKVTILKRGQALDNDENAEKKTEKTTLFHKKKKKKTVSFDKENRNENKIQLLDKQIKLKLNKYAKKTELFDKQIKYEQKKTELFDEQNSCEKKTKLFDKENEKEKKSLLIDGKKEIKEEEKDIVRESVDSESIEMLLMRLGPEPVMLPRFYAGSVFVDSPSPSSVPFPSFLAGEAYDEDASSDLRRLLKIHEFEIANAG